MRKRFKIKRGYDKYLVFLLAFFQLFIVFCHQFVDPVYRIQQFTDGCIMIQSINDQSNVFAHIAVYIIRLLEKFIRLIYQIGGKETVKVSVFVCSVKTFQAIGEKPEGGAHKNLGSAPLFQQPCYFQHTVSGRDHIIDDDHIFAGYVRTQEFMGYNGIPAIYDGRVVPAFIEHTHIDPQHIGQIDGTAGTACIRADDHQTVAVDFQIRFCLKKPFDKLVSRLDCFKSMKRNGILHPGIMSVKCDDIIHAHMDQLLEGQGTVQGFPPCSFVLAAFIQEWHEHIDSSGLSSHSGDDPFQILKMIVGRHVV